MAIPRNVYATEQAARDAYLVQLLRYTGIKEGSAEHAQIIAAYNLITPRPRGHVATVKDSWCAIFLCAIAWAMGFRDWPWECSCSRIMMEAKVRGIWHGGWSDGAQLGQWVIYDLDKSGAVDHIGAVCHVSGNDVWIVEGNYSNTVKVRRIQVGDERVAGFVDVDYTELVDDGNLVDTEPPRIPIEIPEIKEEDDMKTYKTVDEVPEYARPTIAMLVERGALLGVAEGDLGLTDEMVRTLVIQERRHQELREELAAAGLLTVE